MAGSHPDPERVWGPVSEPLLKPIGAYLDPHQLIATLIR